LARRHALERRGQAALLQLPLQYFAMSLEDQQVLRIVPREDVVQQLARRLELLHRLVDTRVPLEDEPRHPRDLPELAPRQLGRVEAGRNVVQQVVGREEPRLQCLIQRCPVGREQLEAVVVGSEGEADRPELCDPVGEQRRQPLVHQPTLDRIEE
jgi:hypothetical protein